MKLFNAIRRCLYVIESFLSKYIFPALGFFILLFETTAIGKAVNWNMGQDEKLAVMAFFMVWYGAKIISSIVDLEGNKTLSFLNQTEAMDSALSKIPRQGGPVDILIYTSFSLFSDLDNLINKYPGLKLAKVRVLVRDPDIPNCLSTGNISHSRKDQINTSLNALSTYLHENNNFSVKFYENEPWVRGIRVDSNYLFYSTYSDKKVVSSNSSESEYSGTRTPWIVIDSGNFNTTKDQYVAAKQFQDGFDSLFNLIWQQCTNKKSIIFDLDGTLFKDEPLSQYLKNNISEEFFAEKLNEAGQIGKLNELKIAYQKSIDTGLSSTESIIKSLKKVSSIVIELQDYLVWKDARIGSYPINITPSAEMISGLRKAANGYNLYILTNHTRAFTLQAINLLGLDEVFSDNVIITINETLAAKPNKKIIGVLEEEYKIDLSKSIFVGDRKKVDLDYVMPLCMGSILVSDVDELATLLNVFDFPFSWIYSRQNMYQGLEFWKA